MRYIVSRTNSYIDSVAFKSDENTLKISIDPESASFSREGNNLDITLENGQVVQVQDFFVVKGDADTLPNIELPSGMIVPAADFLLAENANLNIEAAMQDQDVIKDHSGSFPYNPGQLMDGLGRLDGLDTHIADRQGASGGLSATARGNSEDAGLSIPSPRPSSDEGGTPDPQPPLPTEAFLYNARAVVHAQDALNNDPNDYSVTANAVAQPGGRSAIGPQADPSVTYLGGDDEGFVAVSVNGTELVFTLTQAALDYFKTTDCDEFLELYYTVQYGSHQYVMQVLVPGKGAFDSETYHASCKHPVDEASTLIHGEWHGGRTSEASGMHYEVNSSNLDDIMTYDDCILNPLINTGYDVAGGDAGDWGADTVTVNCHVLAMNGKENYIVAKGDDSSITVEGEGNARGVIHASAASSLIIEASGKDSFIDVTNSNPAGLGVEALAGSDITLDAGGENGWIDIKGGHTGLAAMGGGSSVTVKAGANGHIDVGGVETGVLSESGGSTLMDAGENGTITVTSTTTGVASNASGSAPGTGNELKAGGDIVVDVSGEGSLLGVGNESAVPGGYNKLTSATGDITITAVGQNAVAGDNSHAHAVNGGNNEIKAENGKVTLKATGADSAVAAGALDGTTLVSGKEMEITAEGMEGGAYGVKSVADTVNSGVTVESGSDLLIEATADKGQVAGIGAMAGSSSSTATSAHNTVTVEGDLTIDAETYDSVYGLYAVGAGSVAAKNIVTADGDIDIGLHASNEYVEGGTNSLSAANGIHTGRNGTNEITAKGGVNIDAYTGYGGAHGIYSEEATRTSVDAAYLDIICRSEKGQPSRGIYSQKTWGIPQPVVDITLRGENEQGEALKIVAGDNHYVRMPNNSTGTSTFGSTGIEMRNSACTIDNLSGGAMNLYIGYLLDENGVPQKETVRGSAMGLVTSLGGTIDVKGGGGDMLIEAYGELNSMGILASSGLVNIDNVAKLEIKVDNVYTDGLVWYDFASGAFGIITNDVSSDANKEGAKVVNIQNTEEVHIDVVGKGTGDTNEIALTAGVISMCGGNIKINTDPGADPAAEPGTTKENSIYINATGEGYVYGIMGKANTNSHTTIEVGGAATDRLQVTATSSGAEEAAAVGAIARQQSGGGEQPRSGSLNILQGKDVELAAFNTGTGEARGMSALNGTGNMVTAGKAEISAEAVGDAYGMYAFHNRFMSYAPPRTAINDIEATGDVLVTATSSQKDAYAMFASSETMNNMGQKNSISTDGSVELQADGRYDSFGMYAADSGVNEITAYTVTITASTAMYATGQVNGYTGVEFIGQNVINGKSTTGTSDTIILNGDVVSNQYGTNTINTGSGDDIVTVNGAIRGNGNTISTGAGDDIITLNGLVSGDLVIDGGDGYDILRLKATPEDFEGSFRSWLESVFGDDPAAMGIESIDVDGPTNVSEIQWLKELIDNYNSTAEPGKEIGLSLGGVQVYSAFDSFLTDLDDDTDVSYGAYPLLESPFSVDDADQNDGTLFGELALASGKAFESESAVWEDGTFGTGGYFGDPSSEVWTAAAGLEDGLDKLLSAAPYEVDAGLTSARYDAEQETTLREIPYDALPHVADETAFDGQPVHVDQTLPTHDLFLSDEHQAQYILMQTGLASVG